ncbi:AbiJ-NTD4 domain-containing protein [Ornithinibacillus bavariensis]
MNNVLKKELSGYRFVNKELVRITADEEIKEIVEAIRKR